MGIVRSNRAAAVVALAAAAFAIAIAAPPEQSTEMTEPQAAAAPAETPRQQGYVPPPRNLKKVGDHWTPYDPPPVPEGSEPYIVAPGDNLWDLAQKNYADPYLWPTIWDANRYITYSHWIYPGDPLDIPQRPTVVTEAGPEPAAAEPEALPVEEPVEGETEAAPAQKAEAPRPSGPALFPAADGQELACSAQLLEQFDPAPLTVGGVEASTREMQAEGDIVFLSAGSDMQIKAGSEYVVVRPGGTVKHPDTRKPWAVYVRRLGRVRVIAVQSSTSTASIALSCEPVKAGDYLVPYREMPVPMIEHVPLARLATPNPGRRLGAVVVGADKDAEIAGQGDIVGIDLSSRAGVTVGDRVLFWKPGPGAAPREVFAQGVVLSTNGGGSMVKVLESESEIEPGTRIEVL
jgi:hypothetical protein